MKTEAELAYVAGIVDLLGRITYVETTAGTMIPQLSISSPRNEVVEWLSEQTGVKLIHTSRTYDRHKCNEHCDEAHSHVKSVSGRWQVSGAKATMILTAILPHVRLQLKEVVKAVHLGVRVHKKMTTVNKMHALGWPIPKEWDPTEVETDVEQLELEI